MKLSITVPSEVLLVSDARKIVAEAPNGLFCLLPRHVDFVTSLVPGLLVFEDERGTRILLATDEGTLVKCGKEVHVSVHRAYRGGELGELKQVVDEMFHSVDQRERTARSAIARLEVGMVRRFLELEENAV